MECVSDLRAVSLILVRCRKRLCLRSCPPTGPAAPPAAAQEASRAPATRHVDLFHPLFGKHLAFTGHFRRSRGGALLARLRRRRRWSALASPAARITWSSALPRRAPALPEPCSERRSSTPPAWQRYAFSRSPNFSPWSRGTKTGPRHPDAGRFAILWGRSPTFPSAWSALCTPCR